MIPKLVQSLARAVLSLSARGRNRSAGSIVGVNVSDRSQTDVSSQSMQVVLICGGRGSRLGVLNPDRRPKAMLPIHGEPLVGHLWRQHRGLTSEKPIVIHSALDTSIPEWARSLQEGAALCPQAVPDGVANAFTLAAPHLSHPALFLLGDVILHGEFAHPWPAPPAVGIWPEGSDATLQANFGVRLEGDRVVELVEKPAAGSGLVCGIGAYLLTAEHLREFVHTPCNPRTGEREITEALRQLLRRGHQLGVLRFSGTYLNVNEPKDVTDASQILS